MIGALLTGLVAGTVGRMLVPDQSGMGSVGPSRGSSRSSWAWEEPSWAI